MFEIFCLQILAAKISKNNKCLSVISQHKLSTAKLEKLFFRTGDDEIRF